MSTNSHFPPPGAPVSTGEVIPSDVAAVGAPTPGPTPGENQARYPRDSGSPVPASQPDLSRNDPSGSGKHIISLYPGLMMITFDTLKDVMGINSRPQLLEHFQNSILRAAQSKLRSFIDMLMNTLSASDISEVSMLFTDYDKPAYLAGHAPSFRPSLGVL